MLRKTYMQTSRNSTKKSDEIRLKSYAGLKSNGGPDQAQGGA